MKIFVLFTILLIANTEAAEDVYLIALPDGLRIDFFELAKDQSIRPLEKPKAGQDSYSKVTFVIRYDSGSKAAKLNSVNETFGVPISSSIDLIPLEGTTFTSFIEARSEATIVYTIFKRPKLKDGSFRVSCSRQFISLDGGPTTAVYWGTAKPMN